MSGPNPADQMQSLLAQQSISYANNMRNGGLTSGMLDAEGQPIANCYLNHGFVSSGDGGAIIGGNHFLSDGFTVMSSKVDAMLEALQQDSSFSQNPFTKFFDGSISIGNINPFGSLKFLSLLGNMKLSNLSIGEKLASMSAIHNPMAMTNEGQGH